MKVVFLGNFEAPYSTENDFVKTYEKLGHTVFKIQENKSTTKEVLKACEDASLFHYVHTHGWETKGDLTKMLKSLECPSISVHLDYWRGLAREKDVGTHPFWHTDFVFTADGGSNDWYREKGINHFYSPAGILEDSCYLGEYKKELDFEVLFVGAKGYHPEWSYRPQLIDWLSKTYEKRFVRVAGDTQYGTVRGNYLNQLYNSSRVIVGDTLCLNFNHPDYFSDRLFETTGRGGFIIFPYIKGIERMFKLGEELITYEFGNFNQLKSLIDYYLEHKEERDKIRLAGMERVKKEHTYTHRLSNILKIVNEKRR